MTARLAGSPEKGLNGLTDHQGVDVIEYAVARLVCDMSGVRRGGEPVAVWRPEHIEIIGSRDIRTVAEILKRRHDERTGKTPLPGVDA